MLEMTSNIYTPPNGQSTADLLSETREMLTGSSSVSQGLLHNQQGKSTDGYYTSNNEQNGQTGSIPSFTNISAGPQAMNQHAIQNLGTQTFISQGQIHQPHQSHQPQTELQGNPVANPVLINMLSGLDKRLQNIEGQLVNQSRRWQNIENQMEDQNRRMNSIEQQIVQISSLKQSVTKAQSDIYQIGSDVCALKTKIYDYDTNIQKYSDLCDSIVSSNTHHASEIDYMMDKLITLQINQDAIQTKQNKTDEKLVDLQWRGMRENLIFSGINEVNVPYGQYENVEQTLKEFLRNEMNITQDINFDRVHRIGKFDRNQTYPRPIVAKFERFKDKEFVRFTAPKTLTGKRFGVNEQFPTEIENKRKLLYPVAKRAKRNKDNKVRLVRDKLFINGEEIIVEESGTINGEQQNMPQSQHLTQTKQPRRSYKSALASNQFDTSEAQRSKGPQSWTTPRYNRNIRDTQRQKNDFELPVHNNFTVLSQTPDDSSQTLTQDRKKKATSPLDKDISSKKQRDETNESSARAQSKIQSYEMRTVKMKSALNVNGNSNSAEIVNIDMEDDESSNNSEFPPSESENRASKIQSPPNTQTLQMPQSVDSSTLYYGPTVCMDKQSGSSSLNHNPHEEGTQGANNFTATDTNQ